MIEVVSNCIHDFMLLMKYFIGTFFGSNNLASRYLLPGLSIGIGIAVVFLAIKIIKNVVWGS